MSTRIRQLLPVLLASLLAAVIGQAPVATASAVRVLQPARSDLATTRGSGPLTMVSREGTPAASSGSGSFGSALVGSAPVQPGPSAVAVDRATNTIYVANGNNANGPTPGGDTVSVIDGRRCNALDVSQCPGPWPTIKVGDLPSSITVDQATDTVYVTVDGNNTVAVFNGATCNALDTSGCGQAPVHVRVGPGPFGIFADDANHTVYVGNPGPTGSNDAMSMINTLTCNASDLAGCGKQQLPAVPVGVGLQDFDVNQATHTVYVAFGNGTAGGVAAFDARTCNASVLSGCGHIGRLSYPGAPFVPAVSVDSANNTIYATGFTNTMAAFDGRPCDAADLAGCATEKPGIVTVAPPEGFEVAFWLALDGPLHTVYVVNQKDDTLSAVSTGVCNGTHLGACATLQPPTIHTGEDPEAVALNPGTQTLYTANQVTNDVSVIDAARCNATVTSGCRQPPPAITLSGPGASAADPAVATLYITTGTNTVAMINSQTCNATHQDGCTPTPPMAKAGAFPGGVAVNPRTHTVYVANHGSGKTGSVSVFDDQTCNATTTRCQNAHTLHVPGGNAAAIAVNPVTDTLYVTTNLASGPNGDSSTSTVSVFNGATCNATSNSGCAQAPHSATVGFGAGALAVNAATDTIYVANSDQQNTPLGGNTVSVINGATCNAATSTGCGQPPQTITLGPAYTTPAAVAIDPATDTIYVANLENGEGAGIVSVINGATCNATTSTGCGQTPQSARAGFGPAGIAFDPANRTVAAANIEDTSISVINAATCNATDTSSCKHAQPKFPAGRVPSAVTIDPGAGTIYVSNRDNTVSIIPTNR